MWLQKEGTNEVFQNDMRGELAKRKDMKPISDEEARALQGRKAAPALRVVPPVVVPPAGDGDAGGQSNPPGGVGAGTGAPADSAVRVDLIMAMDAEALEALVTAKGIKVPKSIKKLESAKAYVIKALTK